MGGHDHVCHWSPRILLDILGCSGLGETPRKFDWYGGLYVECPGFTDPTLSGQIFFWADRWGFLERLIWERSVIVFNIENSGGYLRRKFEKKW
ncbi:MAG: hypothetical protein CM15mP95_1560 [Alphaproteobacteria bacterium]|nr:MAG: hypothetical protein CM15mP95_1560 [Alphaproteobacteria bacterium]